MNDLTQRLTQLSAAEEFLEFFAIPFEQSVVNVSRLHILKRFYQYLRQERGLGELDEAQMFACYRCLLYTSPSPRDRTRYRMPSSA